MALTQSQQVANYAILRRTPEGHVLPEAINTNDYTYVASAISLAMDLMETTFVRNGMAQLALQFDTRHQEAAWYQRFYGNGAAAQHRVNSFLAIVRAEFPWVVIDETMTNPDNLGVHPRGQWSTSFNSRAQMVTLNAGVSPFLIVGPSSDILANQDKRVRDMSATNNSQEFQTFQFMFANTLLHEVGGHLLITYLNGGRTMTPPRITAPGYPNSEAGRGQYIRFTIYCWSCPVLDF
jgi:hypothetical protein